MTPVHVPAVPGQAAYEGAARAAAQWGRALPPWDEMLPGDRTAWAHIQAAQPLGVRVHCFCPGGPRVIEWSGRHHSWCHTDGWACPDSTGRPAPDTAGAVLF